MVRKLRQTICGQKCNRKIRNIIAAIHTGPCYYIHYSDYTYDVMETKTGKQNLLETIETMVGHVTVWARQTVTFIHMWVPIVEAESGCYISLN